MKSILDMLAAYNRWANRRLYAAAAELADADYRADHGAFFGSVHGTLNHLLAGDRIWMWRLTGQGDVPARLDEILYDDFVELARGARGGGRSASSPMWPRSPTATSPARFATGPSPGRSTSSRSFCRC